MAEIRINTTGGLKLYDADDSHYAQIVAGTITANVDLLTLNSAGVTVLDGAIDFDIASHDTSNGLKLGGTLVTATAAELNIMDGVTSTAAELNILDGVGSTASELNLLDGSAKSTSSITVADADAIICIDGTTTKQIPASDLKTYAGFTATSITGATELAVPPAGTDEMVFSDAGTLKRLDLKLMQNRPIFFAYHSGDHAIPNGAATKLAFDTEVIDSDSCYDHDSTIGRATIPAGMGGVWVFGCKLYCPGIDSTEILRCELHINGDNATNYYGNMYHTSRSTNESLTIAANIVVEAAAADYFEWYCFQNSGDEQNLASKKGNNQIFGWRIAGGEL